MRNERIRPCSGRLASPSAAEGHPVLWLHAPRIDASSVMGLESQVKELH